MNTTSRFLVAAAQVVQPTATTTFAPNQPEDSYDVDMSVGLKTEGERLQEADAIRAAFEYASSGFGAQGFFWTSTTASQGLGDDGETERLFLAGMQSLARAGETQQAIVLIYDHVDELLQEKRFSTCNLLLQNAKPDAIAPELTLALLTATAVVPTEKLPAREFLWEAANQRFQKAFGASDSATILANLR